MADAHPPFTAWLKRQRRALDLTQEELADQIGCALVSLHKIESGERRPSKQVAERLAQVLHIPPAEQTAFIAYARATYADTAPAPPETTAVPADDGPWQAAPASPSAVPVRRHNLPRQLTSFVGREREIVEVTHLLTGTCLLTLTGAGGSGKTRLALRVVEGLVEDYPDGVWWVDLARLSDPELLPQAVAGGLGLRPEGSQPVVDQVAAYLQRRHLLLLLDNCEHLIGACAAFAEAFLRTAPKLTILATSREPLGIAGETLYRVPTLQVADPQHLPPLDELAQVEAVRLFRDRAAAAQVGFALTAAVAGPVAEICERLDGMPLAIELAASRVKLLPVDELCVRLDDRFRLLTGGSRTALPRHQTLRATLEWSHALLSEEERTLFRRLAVFAGGWDLEAAEAVCATGGLEGQVLDLLAGLVDKSLAVAGWQGKAGRFSMLETMRHYARERLAESGEAAAVQQAHADYCLDLAERAEPKLFNPEQDVWLARLEDEHNNLCEAYAWMRGLEDPQPGLRLCGALWRFWEIRGHLAEGQAWLAALLRRATAGTGTAVRASALLAAGVCDYYVSDGARAAAQLGEGLNLFRSSGDRQGMAHALYYQGLLSIDRGALARRALARAERSAVPQERGPRGSELYPGCARPPGLVGGGRGRSPAAPTASRGVEQGAGRQVVDCLVARGTFARPAGPGRARAGPVAIGKLHVTVPGTGRSSRLMLLADEFRTM